MLSPTIQQVGICQENSSKYICSDSLKLINDLSTFFYIVKTFLLCGGYYFKISLMFKSPRLSSVHVHSSGTLI